MNKKVKIVLLIFLVLLIALAIMIPLVISSNKSNLQGTHADSVTDQTDRYIREYNEKGPEGVPSSVAIPANGVIPEIEAERNKEEEAQKAWDEYEKNKKENVVHSTTLSEEERLAKAKAAEEEKAFRKQMEEDYQKYLEILYRFHGKEKIDKMLEDAKTVAPEGLPIGTMTDEAAAIQELVADIILNNELSNEENKLLRNNISSRLNNTKDPKYDALKEKIKKAEDLVDYRD